MARHGSHALGSQQPAGRVWARGRQAGCSNRASSQGVRWGQLADALAAAVGQAKAAQQPPLSCQSGTLAAGQLVPSSTPDSLLGVSALLQQRRPQLAHMPAEVQAASGG